MHNRIGSGILALLLVLGLSLSHAEGNRITNGALAFTVSNDLRVVVSRIENGKDVFLCNSPALFHLKTSTGDVQFPAGKVSIKQHKNSLSLGALDASGKIYVSGSIIADRKFNQSLTLSFDVKNISQAEITLTKVELIRFELNAQNFGADSSWKFETFQGGSYIARPDWVFALTKDYARGNFMGNNNPDYGGGIPVVDLWARKQGIAFASLAPRPEQISLPVQVTPSGQVAFALTDERAGKLAAGAVFQPVPIAIILHNGDFYNPLHEYSLMMQSRGFRINQSVPSARETEWCAWGYGRDFTLDQIYKALPMAAALNFKWATLDDGWQDADGDWGLSKEKFPNGNRDFKALVDSMHAKKLKARLWWVPLTAGDSAYNVKVYPNRMNEYAMKVQSKLALEHPDWFVLDKDGNRYQVEWWNTYVLCPALPEVREYYKKFLTKALNEWGFDGFKIDGQNLNAVPPCYNPAHHHATPYESCYAIPEFFKMVYQTVNKLRDNAVIQMCPCGSNFSFYNIPWTSQFVASDPSSSWQVRHRGKTFQALVGNKVPFAGDHVELTNRQWDVASQKSLPFKSEDFASTVAVGGVIATKFTAPGIKQMDSTVMLTPDKEAIWKNWMNVYDKEQLSSGEYVNLYDIAFDVPETHVIKKGNVLYYSFFSDKPFNGNVTLRGLGGKTYSVVDYANGKKYGDVTGKNPNISVDFRDFLLLKVVEKP